MSIPLAINLPLVPKWSLIHPGTACDMAKKPKETRNVQIKIQGTPTLKAFVDEFVQAHDKVGSRNDFAEAAFRYFAKKYEEAGGLTDGEGFPKDLAAETVIPYETRGRPHQKK